MLLKENMKFEDYERILKSVIKSLKRGLITEDEAYNKIVDLHARYFK